MPRSKLGVLTPLEEKFCWSYVMNGKTPHDAVLEAGYKSRSPENVYHEAQRVLGRSKVQRRIDTLIKQREREFMVDKKYVVNKLRKVAEEAKANSMAQLKALELLGKSIALFTERIERVGEDHSKLAEKAWEKNKRQEQIDKEQPGKLKLFEKGREDEKQTSN